MRGRCRLELPCAVFQRVVGWMCLSREEVEPNL
ncbi:hypothetical protein MDA_GLEAN10000399 [Myotis davidii]|uniref:Uncharacterized protein n=1 Tax=Myotis davidii TaxID=225400 RepID=L5LW54_MYODS|nr:hypothetical protein MDA_GLEAN10000399 [Myotis davidii]